MNRKKIKNPLLVFFLFIALATILFLTQQTSTREKRETATFHKGETEKIKRAWSHYEQVVNDTILPYISYQERVKNLVPMINDRKGTIRVYPNDSIVLIYMQREERILIGYHPASDIPFEEKIISCDSITSHGCYIAGKKTSLEEFKRHYPYPFGQ